MNKYGIVTKQQYLQAGRERRLTMTYTISRLDKNSNVYLILKPYAVIRNAVYARLPLTVYGFIKIEQKHGETSVYQCLNIAKEVYQSGELDRLIDEANQDFWKVD